MEADPEAKEVLGGKVEEVKPVDPLPDLSGGIDLIDCSSWMDAVASQFNKLQSAEG